MIDLIIRRNTVESGLSLSASSGANTPMSTPTTMEMIIQLVSEMRRRLRKIIMRSFRVASGRDRRRRLDGNWTGATSKRRVSIAVDDVKHQTDEKPPAKTHPGEPRQATHHEEAKESTHDSYDVHVRYSEWSRPLGIHIPKHDHPDADQSEREQRSDIRQVISFAGVADQRPEGDEDAGEHSGDIGCPILSVYLARPPRK